MQIFPTRTTVHLALAALGTVTAGLVLRIPAVVAWGGAMIAGVALTRATAKLSVLRLRAAGLEMIWRTSQRVRRVARNATVEIEVELRNRDRGPVRYGALRAVASRELEVSAEPEEGVIPPFGTANLCITVNAPRVGRHCIHGLALEVRGPPGLFEVPLAFANPVGIEVMPRSFAGFASSARGGRSRLAAEAGASDPHPGTGTELYELREHSAGDPFKRIAWKASARRGHLMVREFEREDRDVVWLVLDASIELLAGTLGHSPLDHGIDEMAALARRHLSRGDRVGLAIAGASPRIWLSPASGAPHAIRIAHALLASTSSLDADRSDYDENDVARRVLEHLRFLDAGSVAALRSEQLDSLQGYAEMQCSRAPFADAPAPWAQTQRERSLRRYLACYGISSPPRIEHDKNRTAALLLSAIERAAREKPRPSLVYVWSLAPDAPSVAIAQTVRRLLRKGISVRWMPARHERAPDADSDDVTRAVADAVLTRTRVARERGERLLRAMGVRVVRRERSLRA
jgi:uncharacterized protein (DUF58 family)